MKLRDKFRIGLLILAVLLVFSIIGIENSCFASEREVAFEILEKGDVSGYDEEAYFVVKTEADWVNVWERHTLIREPQEPPPSIDFSRNLIICAFMGRRPTTGYSIDVERIWTDGEQIFVDVTKRGPPEGFAVGEMITCPYVMVLVDKTDMPFVFHVIDENGETGEYVLAEFSMIAFSAVLFIFLLLVAVVLIMKSKRPKATCF